MSLSQPRNPSGGEPLPQEGTSPAEQLGRVELHRPELLALSESMFEVQHFAQFRAQVEGRWRGWRSSPTALVLVGLSYYQEREWERAREFVDSAEALWVGMGKLRAIDNITVELVRSSLACCRALIELGEKDAGAARRVLEARVHAVKTSRRLTSADQARVIDRIKYYLADRRMKKLANASVIECVNV